MPSQSQVSREVTSPFIAEFRQRYPEYNNLTDDQLSDAVYKKFYSDMPREQFEKQVSELHEFPADFTEEEIATALKSTVPNPWATLGTGKHRIRHSAGGASSRSIPGVGI